jgi:hypothetical protein
VLFTGNDARVRALVDRFTLLDQLQRHGTYGYSHSSPKETP